MSAASRFNPKMLPSFDCHTLERCTPTLHFLPEMYTCMIADTTAGQDTCQDCRYIAPAYSFTLLPPLPNIHALNAERVDQMLLSGIYYLSRAAVFADVCFVSFTL